MAEIGTAIIGLLCQVWDGQQWHSIVESHEASCRETKTDGTLTVEITVPWRDVAPKVDGTRKGTYD